jgi:hydroxymethylbilane synthase
VTPARPATTVRLGTRGSALALAQSGLVAQRLTASGLAVELVTIVTEGDVRTPDTAWGEGAFVGALERALADGRIDVAVHSAKDVPLDTRLPVAAFPDRAEPSDALVTASGPSRLDRLPHGTVVGTDSPRRAGFLRAARGDLQVVPLHGNVDTRLRRLDEGAVGALVLAAAGLIRLGLQDRIGELLDPAVVPPAPGQGALAVQVRPDTRELWDLVTGLDDPQVRLEATTERALLEAAGGGCRAPLGALARAPQEHVALIAGAVRPDGGGRQLLRRTAPIADALQLARSVGGELRAAGYRPEVSEA